MATRKKATKKAKKSTRKSRDRKSTRLNSSHLVISYAVFCLKKKKTMSKHKRSSPMWIHPSLLIGTHFWTVSLLSRDIGTCPHFMYTRQSSHDLVHVFCQIS